MCRLATVYFWLNCSPFLAQGKNILFLMMSDTQTQMKGFYSKVKSTRTHKSKVTKAQRQCLSNLSWKLQENALIFPLFIFLLLACGKSCIMSFCKGNLSLFIGKWVFPLNEIMTVEMRMWVRETSDYFLGLVHPHILPADHKHINSQFMYLAFLPMLPFFNLLTYLMKIVRYPVWEVPHYLFPRTARNNCAQY